MGKCGVWKQAVLLSGSLPTQVTSPVTSLCAQENVFFWLPMELLKQRILPVNNLVIRDWSLLLTLTIWTRFLNMLRTFDLRIQLRTTALYLKYGTRAVLSPNDWNLFRKTRSGIRGH